MTLTQQPTITTEHFVLRPLRTSDAGLIELYSSDERVARMTNNIAHPLPPGATEALLMRANDPKREQDIWAIDMTHKGGPDLIGLIMLNRLDESQSEVTGWSPRRFGTPEQPVRRYTI